MRYTWIGAILNGRKQRSQTADTKVPGRTRANIALWVVTAFGVGGLMPSTARGSELPGAPSGESTAVTRPVSEPGTASPPSSVSRDADLPQPLTTGHFQELKANSPFTRALNLEEKLRLTGIAHVDGKPVATVLDRETRKTHVITEIPNPQGWKLVGVASSGSSGLSAVSASISIGGEVITVHYDETPAESAAGSEQQQAATARDKGHSSAAYG